MTLLGQNVDSYLWYGGGLKKEFSKAEVNSKITVLKTPINEPYKWAQLFSKSKTDHLSKGLISNQKKQSILEKGLLFIRGNFFIPDARVSWVRPSVSFLSDYIKVHQIDTIITTPTVCVSVGQGSGAAEVLRRQPARAERIAGAGPRPRLLGQLGAWKHGY